MDVKTMAKLTFGKYERIYKAQKAIENVFILGGISVEKYCQYEDDFFSAIIDLFGQKTFDRFMQRQYGE